MEAPKLPFRTSEVSYLAGVEQKRIEHWLEKDNIYLDGIAFRPGETKHRRYSELDVIRVAIIALLNDHGVTVRDANALAEEVTDPYHFRSGNAAAIPVFEQTTIVLRMLESMRVFVWFDRQNQKWRWGGVIEGPGGFASMLMGEMEKSEVVGNAYVAMRARLGELDAYITVNTSKIIERYVERLKEMKPELETEKEKI